jgi:anthranilate synthase/aminodeoxychorismate synthase-like glutamine amidotransferase
MILVIDNYDSFTYNLVQYLGQVGVETVVHRNDAISLDAIKSLGADGILLSPGPCTPRESGVCLEVLDSAFKGEISVPIFGVCLGMQAMGHVGGGIVDRAGAVRHGKTSPVSHDGKGVFEGIPSPFQAIRYHSLVIQKDAMPKDFVVTATAEDDGEIMGIRHKSLPIEGVQFHPESVLTQDGLKIVENFVRMTQARVLETP